MQLLTPYEIAATVVNAWVVRHKSIDFELMEASRAAGFPLKHYTKTTCDCVAEIVGDSQRYRGWEPMLIALVESENDSFSAWMNLQIKGS